MFMAAPDNIGYDTTGHKTYRVLPLEETKHTKVELHQCDLFDMEVVFERARDGNGAIGWQEKLRRIRPNLAFLGNSGNSRSVQGNSCYEREIQQATSNGFAIQLKDIRRRADVNYAALTGNVARLLARPVWPLMDLGSLLSMVQYGCSERASREPAGTPIIRMNNLQEQGLDLSDLKYVVLSPSELSRWKLFPEIFLLIELTAKSLLASAKYSIGAMESGFLHLI